MLTTMRELDALRLKIQQLQLLADRRGVSIQTFQRLQAQAMNEAATRVDGTVEWKLERLRELILAAPDETKQGRRR